MKQRIIFVVFCLMLIIGSNSISFALQSPLSPLSTPNIIIGEPIEPGLSTPVTALPPRPPVTPCPPVDRGDGPVCSRQPSSSPDTQEVVNAQPALQLASYACIMASRWWGFDGSICEVN